jgi:transcriptional regulator with XRE-family HTH domain
MARRQRALPDSGYGRRILAARVAAGLSQSEVCRRLGRPQSWLSKIESEHRNLLLAEADALTTIYGVSLDSLRAPPGQPAPPYAEAGPSAPSTEPSQSATATEPPLP